MNQYRRPEQPLEKMIQEDQKPPSGYGYPKMTDGCCHKTVLERCSDCSFRNPDTCSCTPDKDCPLHDGRGG